MSRKYLLSFFALACTPTKFDNKQAQPAPKSSETPQITATHVTNISSPPEVDNANRKKLCSLEYKALRIAFIVDNSGSNGSPLKNSTDASMSLNGIECQNPATGPLMGTDPRVCKTSARGLNEIQTDRQNALYEIISHIAEQDSQALKQNPEFLGTDVGISYFPSDNVYSNMGVATEISGKTDALPQSMTNLKTVSNIETFKLKLWDALKFTWNPLGVTPYTTGIESASKLLKSERSATEIRPEIVLFLTDGLPTDERPTTVKTARQTLGAETKLFILSVFNSNDSEPQKKLELQNSEAYKVLKNSFMDESPGQQWARKQKTPPGNDGYTRSDTEFERYWSDLRTLPKQISNDYLEIQGANNLKSEIVRILGTQQKCL